MEGYERDELRGLCDTCRALFAGQAEAGPFHQSFWHHRNFYSFKYAKRTCRLCYELWEELQSQFPPQVSLEDQELLVLCVAGTTADLHPNREMHQIQFDLFLRGEDSVADQSFVDGYMGLRKPRVVEQDGIRYVYAYVVCFELQPIAKLSPQRSDVEIGFHSKSKPCRELIAGWYQNCQHHVMCTADRSVSAPLLPERVLDVGRTGEKLIKLHVRDRSSVRYAPFVTLSYSWGQEQSFQLNGNTEQRLLSGVPASELPKTFRNAIALVRQLGLRYLWIDSLCIVQDSVEDWQKQADLMGRIYKRCNLCIAATAAENSNGGLFFDRDVCMLRPIQVRTAWPWGRETASNGLFDCFVQAPYNNNIMKSHLNTRGWVTQERLLPPRILHCAKKELVWECNTVIATETYPQGLLAGRDHHPSDRLYNLLKNKDENSQHMNKHDRWLQIITHYSACNLSRDADILIAISGLAQEWQEALNDVYLAGLWKDHLNVGLLWYPSFGHDMDDVAHPPEKPNVWRAPTWSWASVKGQVQYSREIDPQLFTRDFQRAQIPICDILDWEISTVSTSTTCQLRSASLKVEGHLIHSLVDYTNPWFSEDTVTFQSKHGPFTRPAYFEIGDAVFSGEVHYDSPNFANEMEGFPDAKVLGLPLLMLLFSKNDTEQVDDAMAFTVEGILLDLSEGNLTTTYERIGHFRISSIQTWSKDTENWADQPWKQFASLLKSLPSTDINLI